jgi:hypothetical protein
VLVLGPQEEVHWWVDAGTTQAIPVRIHFALLPIA